MSARTVAARSNVSRMSSTKRTVRRSLPASRIALLLRVVHLRRAPRCGRQSPAACASSSTKRESRSRSHMRLMLLQNKLRVDNRIHNVTHSDPSDSKLDQNGILGLRAVFNSLQGCNASTVKQQEEKPPKLVLFHRLAAILPISRSRSAES